MKDYSNYHPSSIDTTISDGKEIFEIQLLGIEGEDVVFNNDTYTRRVLIQRHTNPLNLTKKDYKISTRLSETLNRGDMIKRNNKDYIVVSIPEENNMYRWADMQYTNAILNFVDDSGSIRSYPCIYVLASMSDSDTSENKYIEVVDGDAIVRVQDNEFTRQLSRSIDNRFIFSEQECFSLKNVFTKLEEGVLVLKLKQSEINTSTDKYVDLGDGNFGWIANYTQAPVYAVSIDQSDSEIVDGNTLQLSAQVTKDGQVVSEDVYWSSSDENVATVSNTGLVTSVTTGSVVITATMVNNSNVSDTINIDVVAVANDNYSYSVTPDDSGITLTDTVEFDVKAYNNGTEIVETFTFSVDASTTAIASDYVFTVIDSTRFSIKNNNDGKIVSIKIVPDSNPLNEFIVDYSLNYFY